MERQCLEQGHDLLGASNKSKDVSKKTQAQKRTMFNRLGGVASPSGYIFPSLLASSLEHCIKVSSLCTLYLSCTLLRLCSLGMAMSILHFLYLVRPYPWDVGNVYFTFLLCLIALCMMYVYLYMLMHGRL